jgi:excisionase family DNA binding protein
MRTDEHSTTAPARLLLRPSEAARVLGVGRTKVYELMGSGELRSVKIGHLRRVSVAALTDYVAALEDR